MTRHVVFIGPDVFDVYQEFVRGLKEVGARVTGVGHTPAPRLSPALSQWLDGYERVTSLLDGAQILEAVREIHRKTPVDLVETADESLVLAAAEVREALGLPGQSLRSARLCRDKPAMKEALRQVGVPCALSTAANSRQEALSFAEEVGYPLILKPRAGLGALQTYRVESAQELDEALRRLGVENGPGIAIEEFIEGHEGFWDTLTVAGEVRHEFISHYYPSVLAAMQDRTIAPQIAVTNRLEATGYDELKALGRRVLEALDITSGATHMEWFFGPKGLKFSEIGARPPGERIWDLYCTGNDIDLYREWAMVVVHGQVGASLSRRFATGSVQVRPNRDGRIAGYRGVEEVFRSCRPWITRFHLPPPGAATVPLAKGYLSNAWFRLHHPNYDEVRRMMGHIGETLQVFAVA